MRNHLSGDDPDVAPTFPHVALCLFGTIVKSLGGAVVLAAMLVWLISRFPDVDEPSRGTLARLASTASGSSTLYVSGRCRAAPPESPNAVESAAEFVPVRIWVRTCEVRVEFGNSNGWLVYSPSSAVLTGSHMIWSCDAYSKATADWFYAFSRWQYLFSIESCQSKAFRWKPDEREEVDADGRRVIWITCSNGMKSAAFNRVRGGVTSMFDAGIVREYAVDPESFEVRAMRVSFDDGATRTVLFETDQIEYRVPLDRKAIWADRPPPYVKYLEEEEFQDTVSYCAVKS